MGRAAIQRDLDRLEEWADRGLTEIRKSKCCSQYLEKEKLCRCQTAVPSPYREGYEEGRARTFSDVW